MLNKKRSVDEIEKVNQLGGKSKRNGKELQKQVKIGRRAGN